MTYKEIVDRIKQVTFDHNMLVDFGYGQLSDIKVRSESQDGNKQADYPYLFLNPTTHNRTQQSITYNFNMIVMEMVLDDDFLKVQSDCQQYIDDVIARLRFHYTDRPDVSLSFTLTPFKERFQDTVAGMTATLSIVVPDAINDCIAPYDN
jgi:hypothetical protein